jgi:alpha-galactosidase
VVQYAERVREAPERFKRLARDERHVFIEEEEKRQEGGHGIQIPIIESIACDIPRVFVTNILNSGEFIAGIPRDFEVEIPTLVSRRGVQGIKTGDLPRPILAHLLRDRVAPVELELAAYEQGSRKLLTHLVLTDKWITSAKQAENLIDEIFSLPYHRELRDHYR